MKKSLTLADCIEHLSAIDHEKRDRLMRSTFIGADSLDEVKGLIERRKETAIMLRGFVDDEQRKVLEDQIDYINSKIKQHLVI